MTTSPDTTVTLRTGVQPEFPNIDALNNANAMVSILKDLKTVFEAIRDLSEEYSTVKDLASVGHYLASDWWNSMGCEEEKYEKEQEAWNSRMKTATGTVCAADAERFLLPHIDVLHAKLDQAGAMLNTITGEAAPAWHEGTATRVKEGYLGAVLDLVEGAQDELRALAAAPEAQGDPKPLVRAEVEPKPA